jgi:hypothetical protein
MAGCIVRLQITRYHLRGGDAVLPPGASLCAQPASLARVSQSPGSMVAEEATTIRAADVVRSTWCKPLREHENTVVALADIPTDCHFEHQGT